jgi:hypothetical protein
LGPINELVSLISETNEILEGADPEASAWKGLFSLREKGRDVLEMLVEPERADVNDVMLPVVVWEVDGKEVEKRFEALEGLLEMYAEGEVG